MGSSAPTVINHLPGMQGIVISHPSVQLVLHPLTTAASQLGHLGSTTATAGGQWAETLERVGWSLMQNVGGAVRL